MFINGDGNWINILNEAVVTYNNIANSTISNASTTRIKMTHFDA